MGDKNAMEKMLAWKEDPSRALKEASLRVRNVIFAQHSELRLSDLSGLRELPAEIGEIPNLFFLDISHTGISSIELLRSAPEISSINLSATKVSDLSPLEHLKNIKAIYCFKTPISDLSAASNMTGLIELNIEETQIPDISPLVNCKYLQSLNLSSTPVSDLTPLASLNDLEKSAIRRTPEGGLTYSHCPNITDPILIDLSKKKNPERTIETLRYLREQVWKRDKVGSRNSTVVLEVESGPSGPATLSVGSIEKEYSQSSTRPARQIIVLQIDTLVQALSENVEAATTRRNEPPAFDLALGSDAAFLEEIRRLIAALQDLKGAVDLPDTQPERQKSSLAKDALREFVMRMAGEMGSGLGKTAALGAKLTVGYFAINILKDLGVPVDDLFKTLLGNFQK